MRSSLLKSAVILYLLKEHEIVNAWLYSQPLRRHGRYSDIEILSWGVKRWDLQFTELEFEIREKLKNGYN